MAGDRAAAAAAGLAARCAVQVSQRQSGEGLGYCILLPAHLLLRPGGYEAPGALADRLSARPTPASALPGPPQGVRCYSTSNQPSGGGVAPPTRRRQ